MPDHEVGAALRREIETNLAAFTPRTQGRAGLRDAAVALLIAREPASGRASVIVTLRPDKMRRHGAQYALPGGRRDAGETDIQAALRETREELGLVLGEADMLGRLDDFPTRSGFRIAPFVLWCDDAAALSPDPNEVAEVYFIPFRELDSPDIPLLEQSPHGAAPIMSAFFPTLGHRMFAPTAAILYQFREIALRANATRVSHFDQPTFAWK